MEAGIPAPTVNGVPPTQGDSAPVAGRQHGAGGGMPEPAPGMYCVGCAAS